MVFEQFQDMVAFFVGKAAYWNNFEPHLGLHVHVEKIPSQTDTLGVNASDEFKVSEHFRGG